jgi:hypothetical protein
LRTSFGRVPTLLGEADPLPPIATVLVLCSRAARIPISLDGKAYHVFGLAAPGTTENSMSAETTPINTSDVGAAQLPRTAAKVIRNASIDIFVKMHNTHNNRVGLPEYERSRLMNPAYHKAKPAETNHNAAADS